MKIVNRISSFLMSFSALTSLASCATIMHGTKQTVGISSNPSNASVWVDRMYICNTPCIVEMTRKDNHIVTIQLEGYQVYEAMFTRKFSGWVFGNIVFGGVIGLAVDAISGGIYKLTPDQIQAELCSNNLAYSTQSSDSCIVVVLQPDPSWEKVGNLVAAQ